MYIQAYCISKTAVLQLWTGQRAMHRHVLQDK